MAKLLKLRRGTTTQHGSFTGAEGEVTVDTDKETLVVHDGSTAGGHPVAAEDLANVSSSTIAGRLSNDSIATSKIAGGTLPSDVTVASANLVNGTIVADDLASNSVTAAKINNGVITDAKINASAAIAGTKISPDFGSQNVVTTGQVQVNGSYPRINLHDSDNENDYSIRNNNGQFMIHDDDRGVSAFSISTAGTGNFPGNLDVGAGIDVTGRVTADDLTVENTSGNLSAFFTATNGLGTLEVGGSTGAFIDLKTPASDDYDLRIDASGTLTSTGSIALNTASGQPVSVQRNLDVGSGVDVTGNITVSGTVDGRDVAADGTKLDGIESSATADQTASEILTAIKTVDGSGSGLDADTLDGMQASDSNTNSTIVARNSSGYIFGSFFNTSPNDVSSGVTKVCVETGNDGYIRHGDAGSIRSFINVENGATADQTGGEIATLLNGQNVYTTGSIGRDSTDYFTFTNNTRCDLVINGSNEFRFENDGDFHADGDVIAQSTTISSDIRLKENIQVVPNALDKVESLRGVTFDWKRDGTPSAGVIAQEVQGVLPEAVKEVTPVKGGDSHLSVNYHALTSILIEAIKELKAEVEQLKGGE